MIEFLRIQLNDCCHPLPLSHIFAIPPRDRGLTLPFYRSLTRPQQSKKMLSFLGPYLSIFDFQSLQYPFQPTVGLNVPLLPLGTAYQNIPTTISQSINFFKNSLSVFSPKYFERVRPWKLSSSFYFKRY